MATETERKFLIIMPSDAFFARFSDTLTVREITQTYLSAQKGERRVRKITEGGNTSYVYTEKYEIAGTKMSREEFEREITEEEYRTLYAEAVSELCKTRYSFEFNAHTIEIDMYPDEIGGEAMRGMCVLEVEIGSEDEKFTLPKEIEVLRELTGTREFSNKVLAKKR